MNDNDPGASGSDVGPVKEDALPTESVDNPQTRQTEENPERIAPTFLLDEIEALKEKLLRLERLALDSRTAEEDDLSEPRPTTDNDPDQLGASRVAELEDYRRKEKCIYGHRKRFEADGGPTYWVYNGKAAAYQADDRTVFHSG